jgi:hypothetical protein
MINNTLDDLKIKSLYHPRDDVMGHWATKVLTEFLVHVGGGVQRDGTLFCMELE